LQPALLELSSEALGDLVPIPYWIEAENLDRSAVWTPQAFDALHRRGLAGAVRADDPEDLTLFHRKRDTVDDVDVIVGLDEICDFDDRHGLSRGSVATSMYEWREAYITCAVLDQRPVGAPTD
jgi:hypothetical protein